MMGWVVFLKVADGSQGVDVGPFGNQQAVFSLVAAQQAFAVECCDDGGELIMLQGFYKSNPGLITLYRISDTKHADKIFIGLRARCDDVGSFVSGSLPR